ncbi:MAG: hypothetical protein HYX89_08760 [Chloroflexi bacterium]|nr:hypothetical protein [Chloroflexota bacterium]
MAEHGYVPIFSEQAGGDRKMTILKRIKITRDWVPLAALGLASELLYLVFYLLVGFFPYRLRRVFPWLYGPDAESQRALAHWALYIGLVVGLGVLYLLALRAAAKEQKTSHLPLILIFTGLFGFSLLFVPAAFSSDIYGYIFYGRMMTVYDANPLAVPPQNYPNDPFFANVYWRHLPAVYGPIWLLLDAALSHFGGPTLIGQIMAFRIAAVALHWADAVLIWATLSRLAPRWREAGTLLYAWNPLVLFEYGISAHNGGMMIFFTVLAVNLWARSRPWWALASLSLAALTKLTAGLFLPVIVIWLVVRERSWIGRLVALGRAVGVMAVVAIISYAPFWEGIATFRGIIGSSRLMENSLLELLWPAALNLGRALDLEPLRNWAPQIPYIARGIAGLGFVIWLLVASWRGRGLHQLIQLWCWALFVFIVVVAPWYWPWYANLLVAVAALCWPSRASWAALSLSFAGLLFYALWPSLPEPFRVLFDLRMLVVFGLPVLLWAVSARSTVQSRLAALLTGTAGMR